MPVGHPPARQLALGPAALEAFDDPTSAYSFKMVGGALDHIFAAIGSYVTAGIPDGTLAKYNTCWSRWSRFCAIVGTTPRRMDRAAHCGADSIGFERESKLLCAFLIWSYGDIKPRSKSDPAPKPASAFAMVCGIRRIHKRFNIEMVSCSQLSAVLKGITQAFIAEHGAEALLPLRKEPISPELLRRILSVTRTAKGPVDWSSPTFLCLGGMFALGGGTGFRKSEVALPAATPLDDRRLRRSSILWLIDGIVHADPDADLIASLVPGRDFLVVKPPRSKADQDGTKFGALPIYLPFDTSDIANAAHWIKRLELRFPCRGTRRHLAPLFFDNATTFRPLSHASVDHLLELLLLAFLPEAEAAKYSFHSFRIGFACSLLAAGCPPATIQALARWRSAESLEVYARLNPSDYAAWVSKALSQRTDSITTRRLPRPPLIDESIIVASFSEASSHFDQAERSLSDAQFSA